MRIAHLWQLGVAALTVTAGCMFTPIASAAVLLGGGAGIIVDGHYCTLATIGHDKTAELIGFTAAQCGGPGAQVVAEGTETTVGTVVAANDDLHYAVTKFDRATVTPIHDFAGFGISGIDASPIVTRQPSCRLGAATGYFCSVISTIRGPNSPMTMPRGDYQPGDDGGPATSDGLLVGMITDGMFVPGDLLGAPPHQFTHLTKFSAILDDVNTNGGPGAGFIPIPG